MIVKETSNLNILRGLAFYLTRFPKRAEMFDPPRWTSLPEIISEQMIQKPEEVFAHFAKTGMPMSQIFVHVERLQIDLIACGWVVHQNEQLSCRDDAFLKALTELMDGEFLEAAERLQRASKIHHTNFSMCNIQYHSILLHFLRAHVIFNAKIDEIVLGLKDAISGFGQHDDLYRPQSPWSGPVLHKHQLDLGTGVRVAPEAPRAGRNDTPL